ncbi:unannotated protein [freshwater metagenome]|uniref:Unannotated protein n=1 Tax=freshwater metagenome TaxID=449393 RepID=A0A6J6F3B1_9ZZZZ
MAINSKGAPALTIPLFIGSNSSRVIGSGSPVRADSSRMAETHNCPFVGTISPDLTKRRSPTTI